MLVTPTCLFPPPSSSCSQDRGHRSESRLLPERHNRWWSSTKYPRLSAAESAPQWWRLRQARVMHCWEPLLLALNVRHLPMHTYRLVCDMSYNISHCNKKSELMLMRCARAYGSSCSQVILVYLHPFCRNSLFCRQKSLKLNILRFKVIQGHRCWHS